MHDDSELARHGDGSTLPTCFSAALEWQLVYVDGAVTSQRRLSDRWRADLDAGGTSIPVAGLPGAGIPASALVEGSRVRVVGIVRRPSPAATDQHFVLVPRGPADIRVLAAASSSASTATRTAASRSGAAAGAATVGASETVTTAAPVSADAARLDGLVGRSVLVGGLVVAVDADGFVLDDGTGTARVQVVGEARTLLPLLGPGDAIGATGTVAAGTPPTVRVTDPAALVRLGDLGEPLPLGEEVVPPDDAEANPSDDPVADESSPSPTMLGGARADPAGSLTAGAGSIGALATAGAMLVVVRRRRERHGVRARIARRVAELGTTFGATSVPDAGAAAVGPAAPSTDPDRLVRESA